jgi:4-amino-4-deoxy-L-arabinose transferase-like glycosyltransferase
VAGGVLALLLAVAGRHGWHRDELYFRVAGQHLDWGFIDQPPFTPLLARIASEIADGNLYVLRLAPAVATAATVVLGGALVRELGGSRRAQVVGAGVTAASGFVLGTGHLLSTSTFDLLAWVAALALCARMLRTDDPRWWLPVGVVVGAAMLNKNLIVLLVASVVVGLAVERRWRLLVTPWAVVGGAVALVLAAPNLLWQAANGWPQLEMADVLAERLAVENRLTLLPLQILFFGPVVVVLLRRGATWLARSPDAVRWRPLVWAWPVGLVLTFASAGRPYYVFPLTLAVGLAGIVAIERAGADLDRFTRLVVANGALSVVIALPVLPAAWAAPVASSNEAHIESIGWPELAEQVAGVVASLPDDERDGAIVLAASYGEAGALDLHRDEHDLPPVHSGHNSYADFDRPSDDDATVVAVRYPASWIGQHFDDCQHVATIEVPHDVPNEIEGTPIHVCRGLRGTWPDVWERLRHLS